MPAERKSANSTPSRRPRHLSVEKMVPDPKLLQGVLEARVRLLLRTAANPGTMLAAVHALQAFRQAVEVGAREGPNSPKVRASLQEAERAVVTAIREASNALLKEMGPTPPAPPKEDEDESLVEVPVERNAEQDEERPNPLRTTARRRPTPRSRGR